MKNYIDTNFPQINDKPLAFRNATCPLINSLPPPKRGFEKYKLRGLLLEFERVFEQLAR